MVQSDEGSVAPAQPDQEMHQVGDWIHLERDHLTLGPRAKRYVAFTIVVPPGLRPGDHLGAVVAAARSKRDPGSLLNVESRVALIARVRVPGEPRLEGAIGSLRVAKDGRKREFTVELRNTGNLLFTTAGTVDITDGRRRVSSLRLDPPNVYLIPGGRATFHATWSPPYFGKREAVAAFDTKSPGEPFHRLVSEPVRMSFSSPTTIVVLGALTAIAVAGLVGASRRAARSSPSASAPLPSDVGSLL